MRKLYQKCAECAESMFHLVNLLMFSLLAMSCYLKHSFIYWGGKGVGEVVVASLGRFAPANTKIDYNKENN